MNKRIDQMVVDFKGELNEKSIRDLKVAIFHNVQDERKATILVSFKALECKKNLTIIKLLIREIEKVSIKLAVRIYFLEYSEELFTILKKATLNTGISLYKNKDVAALFLIARAFQEDIKVLVYDEDEYSSKKLYFNLCAYGYAIERAPDMETFLAAINDESFDIIVSRTQVNKRVVKEQKTLSLSKNLIVNLPIFMNKAAETLMTFTGLEAHKITHKIQEFDTTIEDDGICAIMTFSGDIEGFFTLVFPRDIASIALETLLGEKISTDDTDTLTDGVGEFCNIITGTVKTELDSKNIKVLFELPKTYTSLLSIQEHIGFNNGVWMDMELSNKPFYMFITK
ncbi:MAG: chemotaxis protein CheX [Arcobacteraceae bacterium]